MRRAGYRVAARACRKVNRGERSSTAVHHRPPRRNPPRAFRALHSPDAGSGDCSAGTAPAPRRSRGNSARRAGSNSPLRSDHPRSARRARVECIFLQCEMDFREFSRPGRSIRTPGPSGCDSCGDCCVRACACSDRFSWFACCRPFHCDGSPPPCFTKDLEALLRATQTSAPSPVQAGGKYGDRTPQCQVPCREAATPCPRHTAALPSSSS